MLDSLNNLLVEKQLDKRCTAPVLYVLTAVFALAVFSAAWICDDAFHSFIMAQNLIDGNGFVYNIGYRVNASTCPFFTLLTALGYLLIHDMYLTGVVLGTVFSFLTLFVLLKKICKSDFERVVLTACLLSSYSFMCFTTSGLENSALYFLVAVISVIYLKATEMPLRTLFMLAVLLSCLLGIRMDNILIVAPMFLHSFFITRGNFARKIFYCGLGFLPFIIWLLFSTWYYGFPFPNTAYAKLNTGFATSEYIYRGLDYVGRSLLCDAALLVVLISAAAALLIKRNIKTAVAGAGVFAYILYVIYIGGDFMAGRHLTVIYLLSLIVIFYSFDFRLSGSALAGFVLAIMLSALYNGFLRDPFNENLYTKNYLCHQETSITDEKGFYYRFNVYDYLYNKFALNEDINRPVLNETVFSKDNRYVILKRVMIGKRAYYIKKRNPEIMVLDMIALSDEFLSRLPAYRNSWRVGHVFRILPKGYLNTLLSGTNLIEDSGLHEFYDHLNRIVSGDLLSTERLKLILDFNLGRYNTLIPSEYEWEQFIDKKEMDDMCRSPS